MAWLYGDSFQTYNITNLDAQYRLAAATGLAFSTTVKRLGQAKSLALTANEYAGPNAALRAVIGNKATLIAGIAFQLSALPASAEAILGFFDSPNHTYSGDGCQVCVVVLSDGNLSVRRTSQTGTALATTVDAPIAINTWYYLEFKATIHDTTGSFDVHLNGVSVLSGSGVDTKDTANAYANAFRIGECKTDTLFVTDFYLLDSLGGVDDDFWGPIKSEAIYPDGAGTHTDFTPNTGSNFQNVDDPGAIDADTTYNSSATPGDKDSFSFGAPAMAGTIKGVALASTQKMDDAGPHTERVFVRASATDYPGGTKDVTGSYLTQQHLMRVNPDDAAAWEDADLVAFEGGYELVS